MTAKGIDVSKYQGKIDFEKVKKAGYSFVIINAGYGRYISQKDALFEDNYKNAKAAGLNVGAYWYSYALTKSEASREAEIFLQAIKDKKFEYPVCFDIEDKTQECLPSGTIGEIIDGFCEKCEKAGYYVCVYSCASFLSGKLPESIRKKYDVWVAHYGVQKPAYNGSYGIWQYTSTAKIDGISTNTDCNYAYKDYPGIMRKNGLNGFLKETAKVIDCTGFKAGDTGLGVYALKTLMRIANSKGIIKQQISSDSIFDKTVLQGVNEFLKSKNYKANGIAGKGFIKLLEENLT